MSLTIRRLWCRIQLLLMVTISVNVLLASPAQSSDTTTSNTILSTISTSINNGSDNETISFEEATGITDENETVTYIETLTMQTTIEEPTTTTPPDPCANITSDTINVTNRTSTMFTALITYNCSFEDWDNFTISYNETLPNCTITTVSSNVTEDSTIIVECTNIQNKAGRDWTFNINGISSNSQVFINETFTITLSPLSLNTTNINVTVDDNLTSAFISVPNCEQIADPRYLIVRCNSSDKSNTSFLNNCTYTCIDLEPGSNYNVSLVRLSIPIVDNNSSFTEDNQMRTIPIGLDKVTNLSSTDSSENRTRLILFNGPRGSYDEIRVDCFAQDQSCSNSSRNLTNNVKNCSNCTSISIFGIVQGVKYECQAFTIKLNFTDAPSNKTEFMTPLQPVLYNQQNSSNKSSLIFEVTPVSDFSQIVSTCTIADNQLSPCDNLTVRHENCSEQLKFNGIPGCDYRCFFTTEKTNYNSTPSNVFNFSIYPSEPKMNVTAIGSRWISISWTIDEITRIQDFNIFSNTTMETFNKSVSSPNATMFSYNYTKDIKPFKRYKFHVKLISNRNMSSNEISVDTLEEAPDTPTPTHVAENVIPQSDNVETTSNQYVIFINPLLFSNDNGILQKYLIYVRQDQNDNTSIINLNGTYADAWNNASIDYLAIVKPINFLENTVMNNISVLLGNDTGCLDDSLSYTPCNGPLKPSTVYKVIVSGCTNAGCTNVLSTAFTTQGLINGSSSKAWVVVFPLVAIFVIAVVLATWKRKPLKRLINTKIWKNKGSSQDLGSPSILLPSIYTIPSKRPKPLSKYINMTNEEEKAIYSEYQELDSTAPQYRQSDYESEYAVYNRYANIPARGLWDRTAVRLTASHRCHDYINANEIRGLYSNKQYIACQGPLEDTCQDFWEMIIQYNISKVVMLTRTEERNPHNPSQPLSKCCRYFPEKKGESLTFGEVVVQLIDIENRSNADLEIRHILIKDENTEHRVFHYYFTGWPDFSVVDQHKLLDLIETVNNHGLNSHGKGKETLLTPIVVHCSAGVGRTGTYIAVDIIMRLIDQSKDKISTMELDVMGIVYKLREDRAKMVQTKDQYMLVNRCVEEYLRRTNRLNNILPQASIYENCNAQSVTTSRSPCLDSSTVDNNSSRIISPDQVVIRKKTSSANDDHSNRSSVGLRQSKYRQTNGNHYNKSKEEN